MLRVITRLNVGGPAIQATLLTARLDPTRFETLLIAGREDPGEGSMVELGRTDRVPVTFIEQLGRSVRVTDDLISLTRIVRIARRFRPDIVHTHLAKAGFVGRLAGRLTGARALVHTYHGSTFRGYFGSKESFAYLTIERLLGRLTTRVIAITPGQRRELVELGIAPAERIVEVPLGLDLAPFSIPLGSRAAKARIGLPPDVETAGIVARLAPIKDVATFLRAAAILAADRPALHVVVVGDGELRKSLEALALESGLGARCHFLGWQADMATVYAGLDVVALSSLNEGSPVSVIEALASGRAVVATSVGGVPDVIEDGETGLLVPPRDPHAMSKAIAWLLDDPAVRTRLGEAGRITAVGRYGAARLVRDIEELYASLVS